jgi:YHS domain-containing protein
MARVRDPVCGMMVDPRTAAAHVDHAGMAYHFCSPGCARRFQADPSAFLGGKAAAGTGGAGLPMAAGTGAESAAGDDAMPAMGGEAATGAKAYWPLALIVLLILVSTLVLTWRDPSGGTFALREAIVRFMTGFFLVFAGFKLMDLRGFADGYATYDLLARKVPAYGFVYPFVELGFGLTMLAGYHGAPLLWAEVLVMAFSGVGVALKLAKKEPFTCACLGTFLKVPLTKVTLVEDFGMALLALILLFL